MHRVTTMGRKRDADTKAGASQAGRGSDVAKEQISYPVMARTLHVNVPFERKKMKPATRRSQRIVKLAKPAGNENKTVPVYELDDSESEVELVAREQYAEPIMEPPGLANGDGGKQKEGRPRKIKKTQEVVNKCQGPNDGVAVGGGEEEQRVNHAEKTQEAVNMPWELNDGVSTGTEVVERANSAEQTQEVANEPVGRSSSQNIRKKGSRYKTLYTKAMRRLEAVTEERNVLSRQLAVAQAKIGVLHDFRDQLSEVTEKLDAANERLEVFQKTMNPQMVDMLRDFPATTTQPKPAEVSPNTGSAKDACIDKAAKACTRSSKKSKRR